MNVSLHSDSSLSLPANVLAEKKSTVMRLLRISHDAFIFKHARHRGARAHIPSNGQEAQVWFDADVADSSSMGHLVKTLPGCCDTLSMHDTCFQQRCDTLRGESRREADPGVVNS